MSALEARLFDSPPCPPEIYLASETRVQPDLLASVGLRQDTSDPKVIS